MGLSDGERREKMVYAINALVNLGRALRETPKTYDLERAKSIEVIHSLTDQLWHAYLGSVSNGAFWLLGGDLAGPVLEAGSPWGTAIIGHCEDARRTFEWPPLDESDPLDGALSTVGLLQDWHKQVYDLYGWTEALLYGLRRYQDEFLGHYAKLDKLASDLQGACFNVFQRYPEFAQAYVGNRMMTALYRDPGTNKVLQALDLANRCQAAIRKASLTEVIAWDRQRIDNEPTVQNHVLLVLRICGSGFTAWNLKRLDEVLAQENVTIPRDELSAALTLGAQREKEREKEESEAAERRYGNRKDLAIMAIHGPDPVMDRYREQLRREKLAKDEARSKDEAEVPSAGEVEEE